MKIDRFLKGVILVGIFAIPFIPLIVANSFFFPFITPKNLLFRVIVEVIFVSWIVLALRKPEYRPKKTWLNIIVFVSFISIALSTFFGADPYKSFWSNFERMEGLIGFFHIFAYFFISTSVLLKEKIWENWLKISLLVSSFIGIHVLTQVISSLDTISRPYATFGNASYLASYALFHIFFALFLWVRALKNENNFKEIKILNSIFYGIAIFLNINALYWTSTRGAILALVGGLLLTSVILIIKSSGAFKKIAASVVVVIMILMGTFLFFKDADVVKNSETLNRLASISLEDTTTESRFLIWGMAFEGFKERPILGWGPGNFGLVFNKHYKPALYSSEVWFDRAHNIVMDRLIATGSLGLFLYLTLFVLLFLGVWSKTSSFQIFEKALLTGLLAAYFFQNLFVFDNIVSHFLFFTVVAYIHWRNSQDKPDIFLGKSVKPFITQVVAALLIISMSFVFYFGAWKPALASRYLIKGLIFQLQDTPKSLDYFKKIYELNTFGSIEATEHLMPTAIRVGGSDVPENIKQDFLFLAKTKLEQRAQEVPSDIRPKVFLADFYRNVGLFKEAHEQIDNAILLSPEKQHLYATKAYIYTQSGNMTLATETFKKAFELDTNSPNERINYAAALITVGNFVLSDQILSDEQFLKSKGVENVAEIFDDRILNANIQAGRLDRVISMWKSKVSREPDNTQARLSLSASYLQIGRADDAIEQINEVIKIKPDFKNQGEFLISEILAGRNPIQ